ncbi:MAG: hypothetical protein HC876_10560 [Chloroflexaceae bacterium]|nr:hypothetical protein [Chloroflexaceae bacterium]
MFPDSESPPRRRIVQKPRLVAVRLVVFLGLLALTVRGIFARRVYLRSSSAVLLLFWVALTTFAVWVMRQVTRLPHPHPPHEPDNGTAPIVTQRFDQAAANPAAQQLRLYPLQTGWTRVSFGQFLVDMRAGSGCGQYGKWARMRRPCSGHLFMPTCSNIPHWGRY